MKLTLQKDTGIIKLCFSLCAHYIFTLLAHPKLQIYAENHTHTYIPQPLWWLLKTWVCLSLV